jgi:hypothetical protein
VVFLHFSGYRQKTEFTQVTLVSVHVLINLLFTIIFPKITNSICTYLEFFGPSLESWQGQGVFIFSKTSRPSLWATQPQVGNTVLAVGKESMA